MLRQLILFSLIGTALVQAKAAQRDNNNGYEKYAFLDGEKKYLLRWTVVEDRIYLEADVQTTGWVGLGFSPSGSMAGADIFITGVNSDGTVYAEDRYATANEAPKMDQHSDWNLISAKEQGGKTIVQISRLLNTCDEEDYAVRNDTTRIIWAMGASDTFGKHRDADRGTKSIDLVLGKTPDIDVTKLENFSVMVNTTMPPEETSYWCTWHKAPQLNGKHHIVAYDAILNNAPAYQHTHHFVFYECNAYGADEDELFGNITLDKGEFGDYCYSTTRLPVRFCQTPIFIWAKGGPMMVVPEQVGFPIGETNGPKYYMIEVHYDNPSMKVGETFETGLAMYYTSDLRPIDAGVAPMGQNIAPSLTVPPSTKHHRTVGHCSSECTQKLVPSTGVTAFANLLHTHASGIKIRVRHFRGDIELPWIDNNDHYDFDFQQNRVFLEPVQILPGDQISVECEYDSEWKKGEAVIGGYSTREEMCQSLIYFYPKIPFACLSIYPVDEHMAELGITKYHYVQGPTSKLFMIDELNNQPVEEELDYYDYVSFKFNWTEEFKRDYRERQLKGSMESQCNGEIISPVHYPTVKVEYAPPDTCAARGEDDDPNSGGRVEISLLMALTYTFIQLL